LKDGIQKYQGISPLGGGSFMVAWIHLFLIETVEIHHRQQVHWKINQME